jgi:hypothetical protein
MAQRLLSIPGIYWSVLCALFRTVFGIVFWGIFNAIFDLSANQTRDAEPIYEGGFWWLLYVIASLALTILLLTHGAPRWLVDVVIAAEVIGVVPTYWAFHRNTRPDPKPAASLEALAKFAPPLDDKFSGLEVASDLIPHGERPATRGSGGTSGRGESRS